MHNVNFNIVLTTDPRHEKTCLRGFRSGETQIGLLSLTVKLESGNVEYRN